MTKLYIERNLQCKYLQDIFVNKNRIELFPLVYLDSRKFKIRKNISSKTKPKHLNLKFGNENRI